MDQAVLWLSYSSTHPHLYTVRRAKQMLILPTIGSSFPSNTDKFGQITGGGVTVKRKKGTRGRWEVEGRKLLMLFSCREDPCSWLTWPSLRIPGTNQSWGDWLKNVVIQCPPRSLPFSMVLHSHQAPGHCWHESSASSKQCAGTGDL